MDTSSPSFTRPMTGLPQGDSPLLLNTSYTITADIEVPQGGAEGMILTSGGRFAGYGFYLVKGKPVFLWNMVDLERLKWEAPDALSPGRHLIEFDFKYEGMGAGTLAFNNFSGVGKPGTGTLKVDGKETQSVDVTVKGDPEIEITEADRKVWFETARNLHELHQQVTDGAATVQAASAHLATLQQQSRGATLQPSLKQSIDALAKELEGLRTRFGLGGGGGGFGGGAANLRGRIGQLKNAVMGSTSVPTATQMMQIREVTAELPEAIEQANAAASKLPAIVKELISAGALFAVPKPGQ